MERLRHKLLLSKVALASALVASFGVARASAQGAVDPSVAPRAASMERGGDWKAATEMLGSYLATAPGDGQAWFQFGRMYLIAAQEWHLTGHQGEPDGSLYLDLAAIAFDHAMDLQVDSGFVYRGVVELERGVVLMEQVGWAGLRSGAVSPIAPAAPAFVLELGANLLSSCPQGGVLVPGTELHDQHEQGDFALINPEEMLAELGRMIAATHLTDGLFHANHASNYLPIRARLPRDKEQTLELISQALKGNIKLKPESMRAL